MRFRLLELREIKNSSGTVQYVSDSGKIFSDKNKAIADDEITRKYKNNKQFQSEGSIFKDQSSRDKFFSNQLSTNQRIDLLKNNSYLDSKVNKFIDDILVDSIINTSDRINRNRYLFFVYCVSRSTNTSISTDSNKNKFLFSLCQKYILTVKGDPIIKSKTILGFNLDSLYRRSYSDFCYTANILISLQDKKLYKQYGFSAQQAYEALKEIIVDDTIIDAGIHSKDPNQKCIWNVINKYSKQQKIDNDDNDRVRVNNKDSNNIKQLMKNDSKLSKYFSDNLGVDIDDVELWI